MSNDNITSLIIDLEIDVACLLRLQLMMITTQDIENDYRTSFHRFAG
jgi:hypothetical protein